MPTAALAAPTDTVTVINVVPRSPEANRYVSGTIRNSSSCLESIKLAIGCGENAQETSVTPAYARSGQKNVGASGRSRRETRSASQHSRATTSRLCASAMEN